MPERHEATIKASITYGDPLSINSDLPTLLAWLDQAYLSGEEAEETAKRHADTRTIDSAWAWVDGYLSPWVESVVCTVWADTNGDDPEFAILVRVTLDGNDDYPDNAHRVAKHVTRAVCKMRGIAASSIDCSTNASDVRDHRGETRDAGLGDMLAALGAGQ